MSSDSQGRELDEPTPASYCWLPDPWSRFDERWYGRRSWTALVRNGGCRGEETSDPLPVSPRFDPLPPARSARTRAGRLVLTSIGRRLVD